MPVLRVTRAFLLAALLLGIAAPGAEAGGGPETTLVVVNDDSPLSKQIANAYVRLRGIDASHVCRISGIPNLSVVGIDVYRERILAPILRYISDQGLEDEIDIITFSADFPYGVDYDADFKDETLHRLTNTFRIASLTGLTYLHELVSGKDRRYLDLTGRANRYTRVVPRGTSMDVLGAHGYRRAYRWNGEPKPGIGAGAEGDGGYYLCTMLGATGIRGNTAEEVIRGLEGAVHADGVRPDGTVYLMVNENVRSTTRAGFFEKTREMLEALGRRCVLLKKGEGRQNGRVPIGKDDVIGCMAGTKGFSWKKSRSRLLPGAIIEHLTSFGAKFDEPKQTKCTAFMRAGAAGSSGAVAEPFALWMKFPLPFMHVHYAEGSCLAEAFYQNVMTPYQLLVLGDPLARPFAALQTVTFDGPDLRTPWKGMVSITVHATAPVEWPIGIVEVWVDGRRLASGPPDRPLMVDTTTLEDGQHELRVVAVEGTAIETRSSAVHRFRVGNGDRHVSLKVPRGPTALDEEIVFRGTAEAARHVEVLLGTNSLGAAHVEDGMWHLTVPAERLGVGRLQVVARAVDDGGLAIRSRIRDLVVAPPAAIPAEKGPKGDARTAGGLAAVVIDKKGKKIRLVVPFVGKQGKQHFAKRIGAKAPGRARRIRLRGQFEVKAHGFYRLAINAAGTLRITIRGQTVFEGEDLEMDRQAYTAFSLEAGWHTITIEYEPAGDNDLWLLLGGDQVSVYLGGRQLRHTK